jgi:hypothetical protein
MPVLEEAVTPTLHLSLPGLEDDTVCSLLLRWTGLSHSVPANVSQAGISMLCAFIAGLSWEG